MTPEEDARISREYGLTPGPWNLGEDLLDIPPDVVDEDGEREEDWPKYAAIGIYNEPNGQVGPVLPLRIDHYEIEFDGDLDDYRPNARAMAASKQMIALLERARADLSRLFQYAYGQPDDPFVEKTAYDDIGTLLDGLKKKGGE